MAYNHIRFAGERESNHENINSAVTEVESWDLQSVMYNSSAISITNDGKISNGEARTITKSGLRNLCKILRIPDPFAVRIPWQLLQTNINELLRTSNKTLEFHYDGNNNELLNVANPRVNVRLIALTDQMRGQDNLGGTLSIKSSVRGIQLINEVNRDELGSGTDISKPALVLLHSQTGFQTTKAMVGLFRMICSNGTIIPSKIKEVKIKARDSMTEESIARTFVNKFGELVTAYDEKIAPVFQRAMDTNIRENLALKIFRSTKKITQDEDIASRVIGFDIDEVKELATRVRRINKANRAFDINWADGENEPFAEMPLTYYEAHNNITQEAHAFEYNERTKLQRLGGDVLTSVIRI